MATVHLSRNNEMAVLQLEYVAKEQAYRESLAWYRANYPEEGEEINLADPDLREQVPDTWRLRQREEAAQGRIGLKQKLRLSNEGGRKFIGQIGKLAGVGLTLNMLLCLQFETEQACLDPAA